MRNRNSLACTLALAFTASFVLVGSEARADEVSKSGKGIVGGGFLGGEVVSLSLAIAKVNSGWPYLLFGGLGAAGGAVGGWAVEDKAKTGEAPMYMLAGGMALLLPTLVVALNATSYEPPPPSDEAARLPRSVVNVASSDVSLSVPSVQVQPLYTKKEVSEFGLKQGEEVRVPLVRASF